MTWVDVMYAHRSLSLELPPVPLFKDSMGTNLIPQIPLFDVLRKFDGEYATEFLRGEGRQRKRYRIKKLPKFLVFQLRRFMKNNWFVEKNPTIVTFPVKNLEMKDCKWLPCSGLFVFEKGRCSNWCVADGIVDFFGKAGASYPSEEAIRKMGVRELVALYRQCQGPSATVRKM